jgi:hypothetical protein
MDSASISRLSDAASVILSNGVANIDELMADSEFMGYMLSQCLYPITLGGMMTRRNKGDPRFSSHMNGSLGNFSREKCVHAEPDSFIEIILRGVCALGNPAYGFGAISDHQGLAKQYGFYMLA